MLFFSLLLGAASSCCAHVFLFPPLFLIRTFRCGLLSCVKATKRKTSGKLQEVEPGVSSRDTNRTNRRDGALPVGQRQEEAEICWVRL